MAQTRIMPVGERSEWILDMFSRKCIGLDGWLDMVVRDRNLGFREGRIKDKSQDSGLIIQLGKWWYLSLTGNKRKDRFWGR